jgi:hypothetical protein
MVLKAAETVLGRERRTLFRNKLSAASTGRARGLELPGAKTPG